MKIIPIASRTIESIKAVDLSARHFDGVLKIAFLDLNHTTKGLHTSTMPLGIGLLAAYLIENLPKDSLEIRLYKFTEDIVADLENKVDVIGFSMYSWNASLNRFFAERIKLRNPEALVVCGGPDITYKDKWIRDYLEKYSYVNYLIPFNAEIPLLGIIKSIFFSDNLASSSVQGAYYLAGENKQLVYKELETKLESLNLAPSPYLTGLMDKFFPTANSAFKLAPFIETNRGCPDQCTFCHTANEKYNKPIYKDNEIFQAEMELFAQRMKNYPDVPLYIADNNFGMFNRDNEIADIIRTHQDASGWPVFIDVTVGKSRVDNILQVVKKLKPGTLSVFMSAQSMTPQVLKNIKRKNLTPDQFEYLQQGLLASTEGETADQKNLSSSGIIIGLPGETRQSFFDTVEKIMALGINGFIPYTLMVLKGTPLGDDIYELKNEYIVKHRIVPQQFGKYDGHLVLDTEEVAVGTPTMTFDDYLECRSLCFFLQVVYGNDLFMNHIQLLRMHSCDVFKWILDIMAAVKVDEGKLGKLFRSFYTDTCDELWDSEDQVRTFFEDEENYKALMDGKYGANLMSKYTFLSRMECFNEWVDVVFRMTRATLLEKINNEQEKGLIDDFFSEFKTYCLRVKNVASFFEDGFTAKPFTIRIRYDFNNIDAANILKSASEPRDITFAFSETSKAIIANTKQDQNWRYKLQQLIRIKNAAENLYPRALNYQDSLPDYAIDTTTTETRTQAWRL